MAIALGGISTGSTNASATISVAKPTGMADGDTLVAFAVGGSPSGTITAPTGWTTQYSGFWRDGTRAHYIFTRLVTSAASEPSSYSFTSSWAGTYYGQVTIASYSGVDATTPVDGTIATFTSTSSSINTIPLSVTTTQAGSAIVASTYTSSPASGTPSGYSGLTSQSQTSVGYGQMVADETIPTASTTSPSITFGSTAQRGGTMIGLRAAASGSAQPLTGSSAGTSSASATRLSLSQPLTGTSAGTSSATASRLSLSHPLTGQAAGTSSASGYLPDTNPGTGTAVPGMIAFDFTLRFT